MQSMDVCVVCHEQPLKMWQHLDDGQGFNSSACGNPMLMTQLGRS